MNENKKLIYAQKIEETSFKFIRIINKKFVGRKVVRYYLNQKVFCWEELKNLLKEISYLFQNTKFANKHFFCLFAFVLVLFECDTFGLGKKLEAFDSTYLDCSWSN